MTALEIIEDVDALEPNSYDTAQKLKWLSNLDGQICEELILTHEGKRRRYYEYTEGDEELVIREPYGHDIYVNFLLAQIHNANGETRRYQTAAGIFNNAYRQYSNYYNRTHKPKSAGTWRI